jgi:hypothetical protein
VPAQYRTESLCAATFGGVAGEQAVLLWLRDVLGDAIEIRDTVDAWAHNPEVEGSNPSPGPSSFALNQVGYGLAHGPGIALLDFTGADLG